MSRYVWEVRVTGVAPVDAVTWTITAAIEELRTGQVSIDDWTDEAWTDGVIAAGIGDVAQGEATVSVIVEIETRDQDHAHTAAALSGGFDEHILAALMELEGVVEAGHSDRIAREVH